MSSEDFFRGILSSDQSRAIARYCKDAHTTTEIIQHLQSKFSQITPSREYWERVVGDALANLEKAGALIYESGKWQTTKKGTEFLEKYFGES